MKRYITLTLITLLFAAVAGAQTVTDGITISDLCVEESGGKVNVSFTADIARKSVASDYHFVFAPVLTDGTYKVSMPPVVVQGKRAQRSLGRYEWVSGTQFAYDEAVYAPMGSQIFYSTDVESQLWMQGADLVIESVLGGCCSYLPQQPLPLAKNLDLREETVAAAEPEPVYEIIEPVFVPETLADTLSTCFPFVANASEFDKEKPFVIYDDERENALIIYYGVGSSRIDSSYRDNKQVLSNLIEVVGMIMSDSKSEVETIVVGGFSSPEGNYDTNDRLAFERAVSVKEFIVENTGLNENSILVFNGSVDWRGLRYMVAKSSLADRDEIIDIIDTVPIWDARNQRGRLGELMKLNGGNTYRALKAEYFPLMRNGAFIKVYYKNKQFIHFK